MPAHRRRAAHRITSRIPWRYPKMKTVDADVRSPVYLLSDRLLP
jgi:hypothetical protein